MRAVLVSLAVSSKEPSPDARTLLDTAPALPQPLGPVIVRSLPEACTPRIRVQTTASANAGAAA